MMQTPILRQQESPTFIIQDTKQPTYLIKKTKEKSRAIVLDSGTLINLSMNGLLYILGKLSLISNTKFFLTLDVMQETVGRPINIPRFELGALRIKSLVETGVIKLPDSIGIKKETLDLTKKELLEIANHSVEANGKWIKIVSDAEMSCLALSKELSQRGIENLIAIDERTTRLLAEKPENLEELMSKKLHVKVKLKKENFKIFSDFRFLRSTELVYVAYKKGILKPEDPKILEAALYATKFSGSSVSFEEIQELKKL